VRHVTATSAPAAQRPAPAHSTALGCSARKNGTQEFWNDAETHAVRPGAVVFTGAAFFFAILVGHNSLRDEVKAPGFMYIESLYIITYFVILAVAFNSVLLVARPNLRLFRDYDNLWVRVLYWPVIWFTLLVVTLLTFYL
jgi:hypothetical protein